MYSAVLHCAVPGPSNGAGRSSSLAAAEAIACALAFLTALLLARCKDSECCLALPISAGIREMGMGSSSIRDFLDLQRPRPGSSLRVEYASN